MAHTVYPKGAERERLEKIFAEKFGKERRLLCIQLDGFSHRVIYDFVDPLLKTPKALAVDVSFCMGQWEELEHAKACGKDVRTQKLAREFLAEAGYSSHYQYQCNPTEVILVEPEDR